MLVLVKPLDLLVNIIEISEALKGRIFTDTHKINLSLAAKAKKLG
jgi:hypothetical protein